MMEGKLSNVITFLKSRKGIIVVAIIIILLTVISLAITGTLAL